MINFILYYSNHTISKFGRVLTKELTSTHLFKVNCIITLKEHCTYAFQKAISFLYVFMIK